MTKQAKTTKSKPAFVSRQEGAKLRQQKREIELTKDEKEKVSTEVILASVKQRAKAHFNKLKKFTGKKIKTKEEFNIVAENVKALKAIDKEAKAQENGIIDPIEEGIQRIRDLFTPFHTQVKDWDTNAKLMMSIFLEDQKKQLAKVTDKFAKGKVKNVATYTDAVNEFSAPKGAAKIRKLKRVIIEDESKVPHQYCSPDINKIEEAFKNGDSVPGCKYEEVDNIAL